MSEQGERLLNKIGRAFNKRMKTDREFIRLAGKIPKSSDYALAGEYAVKTGELLSASIIENVQSLPNIPRELAEEVLPPLLEYDYSITAEAAKTVQDNLNAEAGLGIESLTAGLNVNRISGLVEKVSSYEETAGALWVLREPVVNYSQAVVTDTLKENAKESARLGIRRYIKREAEATETKRRKSRGGKRGSEYVIPCEFCARLEGTYEYKGNGSNIPAEVYQQHLGCRCRLTYINGNERQNVWDHAQKWNADDVDGQRKAYEQVQRQRAYDQERKAKEAATRAAEVEWLMDKTGMSAKQASIWRNMRIDAIRRAGGIEKYWQQERAYLNS